jgi:hypothetical protein
MQCHVFGPPAAYPALKGCNMGDLEKLSELHTFPDRDMGAAAGRYPRSEAMPTEVEDHGDPPAFVGISHRDFPFDFETVLGLYDVDKTRITRFTRGIKFVAETLHVPLILVERIVRYHEYAHAVHHRGVTKSNILPAEAAELLRRNDLSYRSAPEETKEQIAQLATLVVIRTRLQDVSNKEVRDVLDHMLETFFSLMGRQSPRYQLASRTRHDDLPRLRDKLRLLLDMSDACLWPSADFIRRIIE